MTIFLSLLLLLQLGVRNDLTEVRQYLGMTYPLLIQALDGKDDVLLRNTQRLAPAQAAQMRQRMQMPDTLPAGSTTVFAKIDNVGQGLLTFLFEDDFLTEQVNFVFCPAEPGNPSQPEHVMTIQILFDDRRAVAPALNLLQNIYQMPPPLAPGTDYKTVLMYPLAPNISTTVWTLGNFESVYQPVAGNRLVTAQLWLTDKTVATQCSNIPKL